MYLDHFNLHTLPFRLSPDPQFLFLSNQHSRAKAYMESTVWFTDGFVVLTGEIGAGKTTLIETFLRELPDDVVVAQINQTHVSARSFLEMLLMEFGIAGFQMRKSELLTTLSQFLTDQFAAGKKVLLIVDEAQNLSIRVLEEIRMLSGIETTTEKVLRIILAGQPELNDKLNSSELVQLTQRVRFRFHLSALGESEVADYIRHRLEIAGAEGRTIFEDDTFAAIFAHTSGIPRLVNTLCDTALMAAYSEDQPVVTMTELEQAVKELGWHADRPGRPNDRAAQAPGGESRAEEPRNDSQAVNAEYRHGREDRHSRTDTLALSKTNGGAPHGRIVLTYEGVPVREIDLGIGRLVIGRTPDNDLHIDSRFVSRHHCQIVTRPEGSFIEDLNSTNGIFIRQRRVRRHALKNGDSVQLGKHEVIFRTEPPVPSEGAAAKPGEVEEP